MLYMHHGMLMLCRWARFHLLPDHATPLWSAIQQQGAAILQHPLCHFGHLIRLCCCLFARTEYEPFGSEASISANCNCWLRLQNNHCKQRLITCRHRLRRERQKLCTASQGTSASSSIIWQRTTCSISRSVCGAPLAASLPGDNAALLGSLATARATAGSRMCGRGCSGMAHRIRHLPGRCALFGAGSWDSDGCAAGGEGAGGKTAGGASRAGRSSVVNLCATGFIRQPDRVVHYWTSASGACY